MADWYDKRIKTEDYVKTAEKKHYTISSLSYSFKATPHGDMTSGHGVYYYLDNETSVRRSSNFSGTITCTGTAPFKKNTYLNVMGAGWGDSYDVPIYFGDPETSPSGIYIVVKNIVVSEVYGSQATPTANADFSGGFVDFTRAKNIKFGTNFISLIDEQYTVTSGTFYYRETGAGSYTSIAFTGDTATIPANTFASGKTYDAYADLVLDDASTCTFTFNEITTIDGTSSCTGLRPQNEVTYGDVVYSWSYSIASGTEQYAYDLQISPDGSTWTDIFQHVVSAEKSASYTQTSSGTTYWRVRGYNQNDVAGSWSTPLYYINNVPPDAPTITGISGSGRQTVTWEVPAQIAYRMMVTDEDDNPVYDTGEVYFSGKSALVNKYLEDGTYKFKVKIATDVGGWSDWAEAQKTVGATLAAPQFTLSDTGDCIQIAVTEDAAYDHFYAVRNGVLIGRVQPFINDYYAAGNAVYKVIGVAADDSYGYAFQTITFTPEHNQLATEEGEVFLVDDRWDDRIKPQRSLSPRYSSFEFLGENRPVHVFAGDFRTGTFTVAVCDVNNDLDKLLGKRVYFATTAGWGDWCVITSLNRAEDLFGNDTAVSMELTASPEEAEYET